VDVLLAVQQRVLRGVERSVVAVLIAIQAANNQAARKRQVQEQCEDDSATHGVELVR